MTARQWAWLVFIGACAVALYLVAARGWELWVGYRRRNEEDD